MRISNEVLGIGVPCTFPFVPISFVHSFVLMEKPSFQYITCDNGPIDTLRNDIVKKAIEYGMICLKKHPAKHNIHFIDRLSKNM